MSTEVATLEECDSVKFPICQPSIHVNATQVNKLTILINREIINKNPHLRSVYIHDEDAKATLPVHVVLGSGEYARIKSETKPRIGQEYAPIAELTKFG